MLKVGTRHYEDHRPRVCGAGLAERLWAALGGALTLRGDPRSWALPPGFLAPSLGRARWSCLNPDSVTTCKSLSPVHLGRLTLQPDDREPAPCSPSRGLGLVPGS